MSKLIKAIIRGNIGKVRELIEAGANINYINNLSIYK